MQKVLFLCTGNSCRSQMAEGFSHAYLKNQVEAYSAGIEAHGLNPYAVKVMQEESIDISKQTSKCYSQVSHINFDLIITVCDHADQHCPNILQKCRKIHQTFRDPPLLVKNANAQTEEEILSFYRMVRDEIKDFILSLYPTNSHHP
jgi:arsenate reductase